MAVMYKLYQDTKATSKFKGKWYARALITDVVNTDMLAEKIQRNCSVKKSDVKAVLTELVEVMNDELQASHRVKLEGFGSFKIGLVTKPADTVKDFSAATNVVGMRVNFMPETHVDKSSRTRTKMFIAGASVREAPRYNVEKEESSADNNG